MTKGFDKHMSSQSTPATVLRCLTTAAGVSAVGGLAALAWGLAETRAFTVRQRCLMLPAPSPSSTLYSAQERNKEAATGDVPSIDTCVSHTGKQQATSNEQDSHTGKQQTRPGSPSHRSDSRRKYEGQASGSQKLRILHLSDIHLLPHQRKKVAWIRALAQHSPDLLILTGDSLASPKSLPLLVEALAPLTNTPGVFVFGSNDYFYPKPKNPFTYFFGPSSRSHRKEEKQAELPWRDMRDIFLSYGWVDLNNTRGSLIVQGQRIDFVGVDDPHLYFDRFPPADPCSNPVEGNEGSLVRIGVAHAPYRRVLDSMTEDGCSLIFAGHTHGGQVCLPWLGALVTNCDLPTRLVAGLYDWPSGVEVVRYDGAVTGPGPWVNVSAGLGTSPFAPIRTACRPEAVILDVFFGSE